MMENYRVASRLVLCSIELVSYDFLCVGIAQKYALNVRTCYTVE
jgi:hypothetical protein